jgi:competence protein ComEC
MEAPMKLLTSALALTMILLFTITGRAEQGKTRMHVINVGQAESILIEMPNHALLIDAGGEETERDQTSGSFYREELKKYLDAFFTQNPHLQRTFYALIISHPHKDHTKYLRFILDNYKIKNFIEGGQPGSSHYSGMDDIRDARQFANANGIQRITVTYNTINSQKIKSWASELEQGSGVRIRFLGGRRGCNDANNDSLVMRLEYGQKSILLTGDSEVDDRDFNNPSNRGCGGQLPYLLYRYRHDLSVLDADVYKVGHHASTNGSYDKFLEVVTPQYAVISAGDFRDQSPDEWHGYYFGHPNETTVKLLERFVTGNRPAPVNVFTMNYPKSVFENRRVEKGIYCTCWGTKALVVTLSEDSTPIQITEVKQ